MSDYQTIREPYMKTIRGWTTLTFDNGQSVRFIEDAATSMIFTQRDGDIPYMKRRTADQFVNYLMGVKNGRGRTPKF